MKQVMLASLLSALAASALTLLGSSALQRSTGATPATVAASVPAESLAPLVEELAAIRRELAGMVRTPAPVVGGAGAAPPPWQSSPGLVDESAASANAHTGPPPVAIPSPTRIQRLTELLEIEPASERYRFVKKDLRDRWILRGEREALSHFGPPDTIHVGESGVEEWWYYRPEDAAIDERMTVTIVIHQGRVIGLK